MFKFKYGPIRSFETGEYKNIVCKTITGNKLKDVLIGGSITIIGITYLTVTAFKNGCDTFDISEVQTLTDLGIIKD